ncbi:hypothetical protein CC80DRAFT_546273 [Byssothecium circinans]|uniref:Uncharacterized protein n=1 Tax=Byssothecium circinans TaxID=147558 RepID=A0A6A5UCV6_9PLEO|nr:hypothetical protein CC80DRAFT_546273 [Byssothecium circinans]
MIPENNENSDDQLHQGTQIPHVEAIAEQNLDFENFRKRAEFREAFGGDAELYGLPEDFMGSRLGTHSTFVSMADAGPGFYGPSKSRMGSNVSTRNCSTTILGEDVRGGEGTSYWTGYQRTRLGSRWNR